MEPEERMAELEEIALERFIEEKGKEPIMRMLDADEMKEYKGLEE